MNVSHLVATLACLAALAIPLRGMVGITKEEGTAMFNCFVRIICDYRQAIEFKHLWTELGPEGREKSLKWSSEIWKVDIRDDPVVWETFPDTECIRTEEERRENVKELMLRMGDFYQKKCKNPEDIECHGVNALMAKAQVIVGNYTIRDLCENPKTIAKKGVGQAQAEGLTIKNAAKAGFKRVKVM